MSEIRFDKKNKDLLRKASRQEIESYFVTLPNHERRKKWLRLGNRYRVWCTARYGQDLRSNKVDDAELVQYVAASGPAHVIDSWSLLARAVEASLRGDTYAATHFGYYAELRAAVALLACEGLGVFNTRHPVVETGGVTNHTLGAQKWDDNTKKFSKKSSSVGTHKLIWPALRHWTSLKRAGSLLEEVVRPEGIPLRDWLIACGGNIPTSEIGKQWLRAWGLDLSVLDDDHNARNLASYRPSEFRLATPLGVAEVLEFVESLWRLFEPGSPSRFPNLERVLLRRSLRKTGLAPSSSEALTGIGLSSAKADEWISFLSQIDDPTPFVLAELPGQVDDSRCHLKIISRAALLLYIATGAARQLLKNASYEPDAIEFWWERHGVARGLWEDGDHPKDPFELWADIEASLEEARAWVVSRGTMPFSLRAWRRTQPAVLDDFGSLELAGIWGLIP
jgi:hypothetical protein